VIYLDSAATTLQKPKAVANAVSRAIQLSASPGRGGYPAAMRASDVLYECRELAADMFSVPSPEQVVLTSNATHGLNIAIRSLVKKGSVVLISGYEHNAVTRALQACGDIEVRIAAGPLFDQDSVFSAFEEKITKEVDVVICNHVSNVFGFIQPVERIARLCQERNKPLIVDASQSAGILPVSLKDWGAEFIAMPGHKGLYGPQGTGLLLCGGSSKPLICGGTGGDSIRQEMPDYLPDRLEAGTQNVCGAAGLVEGMRFVRRLGGKRIALHERKLCLSMIKALSCVQNIHILGDGTCQSGVLSVYTDDIDCEELAQKLGKAGVAVRAGLHCAPLAHQTAGTADRGTVRMSFSAFNTMPQTVAAAAIIKDTIKKIRAQL